MYQLSTGFDPPSHILFLYLDLLNAYRSKPSIFISKQQKKERNKEKKRLPTSIFSSFDACWVSRKDFRQRFILRLFFRTMYTRNFVTYLIIVVLCLLLASYHLKISFIQTPEKKCFCPYMATTTKEIEIEQSSKATAAFPTPPKEPIFPSVLSESSDNLSLEEALILRRQNIRKICQAKGYEETDIPIREDKERSSLYRYSAMNLFICMYRF